MCDRPKRWRDVTPTTWAMIVILVLLLANHFKPTTNNYGVDDYDRYEDTTEPGMGAPY